MTSRPGRWPRSCATPSPPASRWTSAAGTTGRSGRTLPGSYQIAFRPELFGRLIPWLALNRQGLTVFVHPETGNALEDHCAHVIWLGDSQKLNLAALG
jgi:aromatic ring-cleaving dioxygenase